MMQWIDWYAAPALVLLLIAALGGFFVHGHWGRTPSQEGAGRSAGGAHYWLLLGLVAALGLAWMAWSVSQPACRLCVNWTWVDAQAQAWVQHQGQAAWLPGVKILTLLGWLPWMAGMGAVTAMGLLLRREWLLAAAWVVGVAGAGLSVRWIKQQLERERPEIRWVLEQGYSFPSGHSAGTVVCYGLLTWVLLTMYRIPHARWWVGLVGALVLGVGLSRVLLGAHYVSDVLAGWLLGLAWLGLVIGTAQIARERGHGHG